MPSEDEVLQQLQQQIQQLQAARQQQLQCSEDKAEAEAALRRAAFKCAQ